VGVAAVGRAVVLGVAAAEQVARRAQRGLELLLELAGPRDVAPDGRDRRVLARDLRGRGERAPDGQVGGRAAAAGRFVFVEVGGHRVNWLVSCLKWNQPQIS